MARCCGGASCACLIQGSGNVVSVTGSGQPSDPYVIHGAVVLNVTDNSTFDLTLTGTGSTATPWGLSVNYAASAKLDDLPDVNAPAPTNAQVLGWDSATSKWTARAPTTAASGSVQHDTALTGDGSAGTPLGVNEDPNGFLVTAATGLGLSDVGKNRIIRHYSNSTVRASATPSPDLNALTMLDSVPGRIDYWTGTVWAEYGQFRTQFTGTALLALSGQYTNTQRVSLWVKNISATTDAGGVFSLLSSADLSGMAGVLGCWFQPSQSAVFGVVVELSGSVVNGHAYRLTDGSDASGTIVAGQLLALLYS